MPLSQVYEGLGLFSDKHPVIFEIGHLFTKAGFAHDSSPRCIVPSTVTLTDGEESRYLSDFKNENELYHMLVEFFRFVFKKHLLVNPGDRHIVIVEPVFSKTAWRSTLAKVLYLHFNVPNVLWYPYQLAATNSIGSQSALVVDFGRDEINVIPVIHGCTLLNHIQTIGLGTKAFDKNLKTLMLKYADIESEKITALITDKILENVRINACFVGKFRPNVNSIAAENAGALPLKSFEFCIDGSHIVTFNGLLREKPAEIWFQNDDLDGESLPLIILETLRKLPIDNRKLLASSILLTGGLAQIPGLKSRLVRELNNLYEDFHESFRCGGYEFKFFAPPCSEIYLGWLGGSYCASVDYITLRGVSRNSYLKSKDIPDWCTLRNRFPL